MSQRQSWHFVAALALCSLSIGCGGDEGGGGGGGGAASIDACAIVTQADATTLFGAPAKKFAGSGPGTPDAALKKEQVKALATAAAGKLPQ